MLYELYLGWDICEIVLLRFHWRSEQVMNDDKRKMAARAKDTRDVESKRREHVERNGKNRVSSMNSALFFATLTHKPNICMPMLCIYVDSKSAPMIERRGGTNGCFIATSWWDFSRTLRWDPRVWQRAGATEAHSLIDQNDAMSPVEIIGTIQKGGAFCMSRLGHGAITPN